MKRFLLVLAAVSVLAGGVMIVAGCGPETAAPKSTTGVKKAEAEVKVQASGFTVEQENVKRRLEAENEPGAIKHLYVISAFSGDVILYSTVKGKPTSSGKRLTPYQVESAGEYTDGFPIRIGDWRGTTAEVLQDDGTYGSSIEYLFWWDVRGIYHQHYVSGGQIVHISDQPMAWPKIILNLEEVSG